MLTDTHISALRAPFPAEALSADTSRGFELTSIKAAYVVERLNQVFGPCGCGWRFVHSPFEIIEGEVLTEGNGQDRENEIVAELGGAVLLTLLGHQQAAADWGGAYRYVCSYARAKDGEALLKEIMRLTNRMAGAVRLILDEAGCQALRAGASA